MGSMRSKVLLRVVAISMVPAKAMERPKSKGTLRREVLSDKIPITGAMSTWMPANIPSRFDVML